MKRVLLLTAIFVLAATPVWAAESAADLEAGKQAYLDNCARCHGPTGAGDGRDSKRMFPHPRKLSEGVFKFRTTASGTPPTDEDLFQTISSGLPGSRMPDFQRLAEETRWQLVGYVKSLSTSFKDQKPEPLKFGVDPGPGRANLGRGKQLYTQLGCNVCHGTQGRGNGPSAATLVDQWNNPIRPADLTQGWNYRSGSSPRDILVRLMTGIDGTPMPSYAEAVKPEEVWDLAYYVHSIQVEPRWEAQVEAVKVARLPSSAEDPAWQKAPRTDLRMSGNFYRNGEILPVTVRAISVQALYNGIEILLRLSWNDPTESKEAPSDAVAVALLQDPKMKWRTGSLRIWPAQMDSVPAPDGFRIHLLANIEFPEEIPSVIAHGAEGIGLYRTEFFYLGHSDLPTEEQQFEAYRYVAKAMAPRPIIIRTIDLGGDKFMSELKVPREMNPFLGWRAIRFCLARPEVFKVQLRAILRASVFGKIRLMYPMISGVQEVQAANRILEQAKEELKTEGKEFAPDLEVGAMIEVPSAAMTIDLLAKEVKFFSIGTNDLIQYSLAVDRVNEKIAYLYEPTHPAILRLIRQVIQVAHENNLWVSMCGEMAGEPAVALILLGMGLDSISTSPVNLPRIKQVIRSVPTFRAKEVVKEVFRLSTGAEVEAYARARLCEFIPEICAS